MTAPRGKVAFGYHAFPFFGMTSTERALPSVPLLPMRVRSGGGPWSNPLNAVLDTGSTHSYLPSEVAEEFGLRADGDVVERKGAGGLFPSAPAPCDLAIVDAHFPNVTCWEIADFTLWVPARAGALDVPLLGWDLLQLFDLSLSHHSDLIQMRLAPGPRSAP